MAGTFMVHQSLSKQDNENETMFEMWL